jgi:WD40 repeat protein
MSVAALAAPAAPYKGLAPFEDSELDALFFFGRERETEIVAANLLATKLTVLYGPSGVGKSSLLRAAVVRRLRELEPDASVALVDQWIEAAPLPEADFLILDQFEEYFLYHEGDALAEQLAASRAHVLLAVREDQVARLDAFQSLLPNVFANRLRLGHLDVDAARRAILGPLDRWNAVVGEAGRMGIETALVAAVLAQVETEPGHIEAPYLQLVLERVWEQERAHGSHVLRQSTLESLGGAEAIVSAHLARALDALPPRDAEVATNALRFLVTPSRTKIAHTLDDLVGYTNESPAALQTVLERLATQRVLRAGDGGRYEIFHDVLAEPVLAWRREREARAALAAATRRHRRLAVVAGLALALAAAMVALTVYAFSQRNEASKQRREAVVLQQVALDKAKLAKQQSQKANALRIAALRQKHNAEAANEAAQASAETAKQKEQDATAAEQLAQEAEQQAQASATEATASAEQEKQSEDAARKSEDAAKKSAKEAHHAEQVAVHEREIANKTARRATVGQLVETAEADLATNPVVSVNDAVKAAGLERSNRVEDALRDALGWLNVRGIYFGGGGAVSSAALSPNDSLVAVGAKGGHVRIYDAHTNKLLSKLDTGSAAGVNVVRFSPDGTRLAVGDAQGGLLYTVGTGATTTLPSGSILDAQFTPDGRYLVTGGADLAARIWDATTGAALTTIPATAAQTQVSISPDGTMAALLSNGQATARIYSVPGGQPLGQVRQPGEVVFSLAFSPDGKYLITGGRRDGFVWDVHGWAQLRMLVGHGAQITDIAFFPNGDIVTGSVDSSARVWDPETGATIAELAGQHQQKVLAVAVSPAGNEVATASADNTVRLWKEPLGATPTLLGGHADSVVDEMFNSDGTLLLSASLDGFARLWDTTVHQLSPVGLHAAGVTGVAVSPAGIVLSGGSDGTAKLWRGNTATTLPHGGKVVRAVFASKGAEVITAGDDGTAKRWRVSDGRLLATYVHGAAVQAALPLEGGVVTAGADGTVKSWSAGGTVRWVGSQGSPITAAAVSSQDVVATGGADGTIDLWENGRQLDVLRAHKGAVRSLAFDATGAWLVSGGDDSAAYIWNVATGQQEHALLGHQLGLTSVSFSPDGKLVLTASKDGDARLWNATTGNQFKRLKFHVSTIGQASFSPDGRWVVTAGPTTAAIWQVRTGRLLYYLNGAKGNLTSGVWSLDSLRIVTGDSGGQVSTFTCSLCATTPSLLATAKARLAALTPSK